MKRLSCGRVARGGPFALLIAVAAVAAYSYSPTAKNATPSAKPSVELSPVGNHLAADATELFTAIDRGDLSARLLPEKDQHARLELENRTNRPLTVQIPAALGARPTILAGVGMPMTSQPLGSGTGGMGGGFFCIPPEHVGIVRLRTVCLDDSKPDPRPGMVYEVCRIEEISARPAVAKLCSLLGDGTTDRRAVQAAVWHVNCERSWTWLAARLQSCGGPRGTQKLFRRDEIQRAKLLAEVAMR